VPGQFPGSNVGAPPGVPGTPGTPGTPGGAGGSNQAINLINQLLTQPRQPPAGIGPNQQSTSGGGLAGVASTYKGTTIKSYGDRTKYQEWEFVFQLNQQGTGIQVQPGTGPNGSGGIPSGAPGAPGSPGSGGASGAAPFPGSSSPGIGGGAASPFGTSGAGTSGIGTSSGFGTSR
jgi:collagen type III alpha